MATELRRRGVELGEIAGLLGHVPNGLEMTDLYAEYSPDFMNSVTSAIDAFFRDLEPLLSRPLRKVELDEQPKPEDICISDAPALVALFGKDQWRPDRAISCAEELRASHVPVTNPEFTQVIDSMVGVKRFAMYLRSKFGSVCGEDLMVSPYNQRTYVFFVSNPRRKPANGLMS